VVLEGGLIQRVMLSSQYEVWEVNGMANDEREAMGAIWRRTFNL
jgi:hypothetical protein